jgi:hypothetical protein
MSCGYAAEPVPREVDATTASYLDRQFHQIQTAFTTQFIAPQTAVLPNQPIPGSLIYLENETNQAENGIYVCIKDENGTPEWIKMTVGGLVAPLPDPPEWDLTDKTWDDFK